MKRRKRKATIKAQPRIPGLRRIPAGTCMHPALERAILREMAVHGVRRSYVLADCAARVLDVPEALEHSYKALDRAIRQVMRVMRGGRR